MYNTLSYPVPETKLTSKKSRSRYLVKVEPPTSASEAFYTYAGMFFEAAHTLASELINGEHTTILK